MRAISQGLSLEAAETGAARQTDQLYLNVVYTDPDATRVALSHAAGLTAALDAQVRVIILKVVPFPRELDDPPVSPEFDRGRVARFVDRCAPDSSVLICYCRDAADALIRLLDKDLPGQRPGSVTVIAGKKRRWFPSKAQRIARKLEESGRQVLFVDLRGNHD